MCIQILPAVQQADFLSMTMGFSFLLLLLEALCFIFLLSDSWVRVKDAAVFFEYRPASSVNNNNQQ
jgi:hypothetical protein